MTIYAVNGKEPIAAWIPSRDTAGNGTTTLTDLVGSNDGTLTNMDAATDWVADTDAGGIRALDFDGSNDRVDVTGWSSSTIGSGDFSINFWVKPASSGATYRYLGSRRPSDAKGFQLFQESGLYSFLIDFGPSVIGVQAGSVTTNWAHIVAVRSGSDVLIYVNGVSTTGLTSSAGACDSGTALQIGTTLAGSIVSYLSGRLDDIRIFDTALDATDIAYLYNSGNGRGIVTSGVVPSRRRRYTGGYGL